MARGEKRYKVVKGAKMPEDVKTGKGRPHKYPFMSMEVGDYFSVPYEEYNAVRCAATYYRSRSDRDFKTEVYFAQGRTKRIRVWRRA